MKIGMQTWGSHGDIRPFIALAERLQGAGHDVTLLITCVDSAAYDDLASTEGVKIKTFASPVITAGQATTVAATAYTTRDPMAQMAAILRLCFAPAEDAMFEAAQRLCVDADLLIGHYFMHPLQIAAEKAGKPYVSVMLSHAAVPSDHTHPINVGMLGKTGNRLLWWLTKKLLNRTLNHYPNRLRAALGMPLTQDIVTQVWLSQHLTLLAISPQICQRQPDWDDSVQVCGFLDMPNHAVEGAMPAALDAFLAAGAAPLYMTFGSWMPKDIEGQTAALTLLTQAARLAGCRAIIQSLSAQACGFTSCERVLYVGAAPHHAIFPRCSAVLHHGGAGTTQAATLAGRPSIIVPHISEQQHWGQELRRLGIGARPVQRRSATPASLARQIALVHSTPAMTVNAASFGATMRLEDGVAAAVALIGARFAATTATK